MDTEIVVEAVRKDCPGKASEELHTVFVEKRKELLPFRPKKSS
jgi:hypothetical protein